jgi:tetratricopeptide (TPR) repeat protein
MKLLFLTLCLLAASTVHAQKTTGDGTRENPRRGEPSTPMPAVVIYREAVQARGELSTVGALEARLKKEIPGRRGEADWEARMGHQLSILASYFQDQGAMRLAEGLARSAIGHYERAEVAAQRAGWSPRQRSELVGNQAQAQLKFLGEPAAARRTFQRAAQIDPGNSRAAVTARKLEKDEITKPLPVRNGNGG